MKIWLDDLRPRPASYHIQVRSAKEAIGLLDLAVVDEISLDHDLGDIAVYGTGYDVACHIEEMAVRGTKPPIVHLHTANPVGRKAMAMAMESAWKRWEETNGHVNGMNGQEQ